MTTLRAQKEEEEKETASKEEEEDEFEAKLGALRGKRSKRAKTASDDEVSMVTGLPKTTGRRAKQKKLPGVRDFMSDFTEEPKTKEWGARASSGRVDVMIRFSGASVRKKRPKKAVLSTSRV